MESAVSLASGPDGRRKRRVSYFYDENMGDNHYGEGHLSEPRRISMTHELVFSYHLHNHRHMEVVRPYLAGFPDFVQFHSPEYVHFLASITPQYVKSLASATSETITDPYLKRFNLEVDWNCPVFGGLFDYCRASVGGSMSAAVKLNRQDTDIAINWAGGMKHAKIDKASRFCYINDIVLGIIELLKTFKRVLYVDIGLEHGDAVEEAFYSTDRVMTVSFHKFREFRQIRDIGVGKGKYYSLNAPLKKGLDDESFSNLFRPVIQKVMEVYQPEAVVLQCGADSLSGDLSGNFNLSILGHADCLRFIRCFNVPLMVLGGGGATSRNVARCWCYETAVAVGEELDNNLPGNMYMNQYAPDYKLHIRPNRMPNLNTPMYIEGIRNTLLTQLSQIIHAPSVQFQDTPSMSQVTEAEEVNMERRQNSHIRRRHSKL